MKHYIIIRAIDYAKWLEECIESLVAQNDVEWQALVHLDGGGVPENGLHPFVQYIRHPTHLGVAGNLFRALDALRPNVGPTDIVDIVDGDDLLPPKALWRVEREYRKHSECRITYGSYIKQSKGGKTKISQPYPAGADVRAHPWRGSHLKSYRGDMLAHLKEDWFKHGGAWLQAASDLALMIPMMEIAGLDRCRHISRPTYIWRDKTPWKTDRALQKRCEAIVRAKAREKRLP
jgi:glycosyltransferase involved in cell wall biosynthesis